MIGKNQRLSIGMIEGAREEGGTWFTNIKI